MSLKSTIRSLITKDIMGVNTMPALSLEDIFGNDSNLSFRNKSFNSKPSQLQANVGWVFTANSTICDPASSVKLKLMRIMSDGEREEVFDNEIIDLLNNPNNSMTWEQMAYLHYSYKNLTGESYILKVGADGKPLEKDVVPTALYTLPSHLCTFRLGNTFGESVVLYNGQELPIKSIIRDIYPDPQNPYYGQSIIQAASSTINTDLQMREWNLKMFSNSARPGAIIEVPDKLDDTAFERLKKQIEDTHSGTDNAFKGIILEGGAKLAPYMLSQQDLDFLNSRKFSKDEIFAMFRISPSNAGMTENVNRANAEAQEYTMSKNAIVPRVRQLVSVLNSRLVKPFDSTLELDFENPIPEDVVTKLNEATQAVNKWATIDEVRALYGMDALPDGLGSQIYAPAGNIPLKDLSVSLGDTGNTEDDTTPQEDNQEQLSLKKKELAGETKALRYTKSSLKFERMIMRAARKMFNAQKDEAKRWVSNLPSDKSLVKKDAIDDMIDWTKHKTDFAKELESIIATIVEQIGTAAFIELTEGEFNPFTREITQYLHNTANNASLSVNNETEKQIRATLSEGIRNNESAYELQQRILSVFGTASTERAYVIAVTESATAHNYADVQAWKQTGLVYEKEWYTAKDERTCVFCGGMHGKSISISNNFFDKGDVMVAGDENNHKMNLNYRDIGEPPLHPRCRCVLLPVLYD